MRKVLRAKAGRKIRENDGSMKNRARGKARQMTEKTFQEKGFEQKQRKRERSRGGKERRGMRNKKKVRRGKKIYCSKAKRRLRRSAETTELLPREGRSKAILVLAPPQAACSARPVVPW